MSDDELDTSTQSRIEIPIDKENLLRASSEFARYVTSRWPQVDSNRKPVIEVDQEGTLAELAEVPPSMTNEPRLNYYFAGSLATMLLAQATSVTSLEGTALPYIKESDTTKIPMETARILASFARPMGDLDYVPMPEYRINPDRLKKGGGGPSFEEIPAEALPALKKGENSLKVMCDPLSVDGDPRVARIEVNGHEYYIPRPDTMIGYKVLHLLQSYDRKPEEFNTDFATLLQVMRGIYTDQQLAETTRGILEAYETSMRKIHEDYFSKQGPYKPKLRDFFRKVLKHPDVTNEITSFLTSPQLNSHGSDSIS